MSKEVKKIIKKIETVCGGERQFSKKEVLSFIKIAELEMSGDVENMKKEIDNLYQEYKDFYYDLYQKF